jgi:hypothetical protein
VDRLDLASRAGAAAAFVAVLRDAGGPLDARGLKLRMLARGVDETTADAGWRRAQPALRLRADVSYDPARGVYRYRGAVTAELAAAGLAGAGASRFEAQAAAALTGEEALERLLPPRLSARRAALASTVRAALKERDDLEARLRAEYVGSRALRLAQERQAQITAVRALAEVVSEVEELAAAGAGAGITAERVRALAQAFGLAPIGRAGELTAFEPARHTPIGRRPPDGSRVSVIRPGYTWPSGDEDVLICRAQVAWLGPD